MDPANAGGGFGGGINPYTAGTLSLLGNGDGVGIGGSRGNFREDGSVVNANVLSHAAANSQAQNFISDALTQQHNQISRQIEGNRIDDKFAALQASNRDILAAVTLCCCETKAGQNNLVSVNNTNTQQIIAAIPDPGLAVANATIAGLQADLRHQTMMEYNGGGNGGGNGNGGTTCNCNCDDGKGNSGGGGGGGKESLSVQDVMSLIESRIAA